MKNQYIKHKSHILYSLRPKFKKIIITILLLTFNITFWVAFKKADQNFKPAVSAMAASYSSVHTTDLINRSIKELGLTEADYSEICRINKNDEGEIISVETKAYAINKIKLNLSENLLKKFKEPRYTDHGIPIGNLTNTYILSGRGPKIPIRITTVSAPKISVENTFEDAGINQTKHKISLITSIDIQIILPYKTLTKTVKSESMMCETIIVGKVPDVYISK